ncbi:hypothetical protein HN51_032171, partial [Arachis hypogaea]
MEFCAGGNLASYIRSHGSVQQQTARRFMQQLVRAPHHDSKSNEQEINSIQECHILNLTRIISYALFPRFSPNGKFLVFLSAKSAVDLGVHNATNSLHRIDWPTDGKLTTNCIIMSVNMVVVTDGSIILGLGDWKFAPWDDSVAVNDIIAGLKGFTDDDVKPFSSGLNSAETQEYIQVTQQGHVIAVPVRENHQAATGLMAAGKELQGFKALNLNKLLRDSENFTIQYCTKNGLLLDVLKLYRESRDFRVRSSGATNLELDDFIRM